MALTKDELISAIESMTVLELAELVKELQDKFGVSAAAPVGIAPPTTTTTTTTPEPEEPSAFNVVLAAAGDKKINVIKVVREITGLGLKEAKELVDSAPKAVKEGLSKEDAEKLKAQLEAEGAKVELK